MILFLFKPIDIKENSFGDVELFSISTFTMYEFDSKGLITLMNGTKAIRYSDRYRVDDIDYTDNSKEYVANMKSNNGIYKDDIVYLDGDIVYVREDGLTFETQKATYNKKTSIAIADGPYLLYRGANRVIGKALHYNSDLEKITSKNVTAKYQLKEK
ncbi:MAG TPA: LPS export ABC transporter periplasmic protein LptC [Sulfurimonas sp.]|uniref:LPS export ABC transporter periplasmic protein LptC n=1 Tax=Sulfurimonas sp. TaxID=2022749 RepID=UPI002CA858BB|nr:LPS export ABC transporter periplasmic protein LptC [Sulfurimonas sp.]HUH41662.1 LPS export ABC transporter periplasmic protein LptC [Sulfurimonas sp.]